MTTHASHGHRESGRARSDDYVTFHRTGDAVKGEFCCSDCGYGVVISKLLPLCPMCGGKVWEASDRQPFPRDEAGNPAVESRS